MSLHVTYMRHNFVSLIYGEYLANVHFCGIPYSFIPHFTLHSAEKIRIEFFRKLPGDNFRYNCSIILPPETYAIAKYTLS